QLQQPCQEEEESKLKQHWEGSKDGRDMPPLKALVAKPPKRKCLIGCAGVGVTTMLSEPLLTQECKQGINKSNDEAEEPEGIDADNRSGDLKGLGNGWCCTVDLLPRDLLQQSNGGVFWLFF
ncbi:hypothetical protein PQX77_001886, partial [Marasmius sp. AFHP31]